MTTMTAPNEMGTDHPTADELEDGLDHVRASPRSSGRVEMVVARPGPFERDVLATGTLTRDDGLVGDDWRRRGGDEPNVEAQVTMINARFLDLVSRGDRDKWPWAGDQVVVDLDLGTANLQPGNRLRLGSTLVEVTPKPHTGCIKFVHRFGVDAQRLANRPAGAELRLRGIYVKVVEDGTVSPGDSIRIVDGA